MADIDLGILVQNDLENENEDVLLVVRLALVLVWVHVGKMGDFKI